MTAEQWSNYPLPRQYCVDAFVGTNGNPGITIPHPADADFPTPEAIIFDPREAYNVTLADFPELEAYDTGKRFMTRNAVNLAAEYPAIEIAFRLRVQS